MNPFSAGIVGNLVTARFCVDTILGCVVNVEMRCAAAETVEKMCNQCGGSHEALQADCPERKKEIRGHEDCRSR